MFGQNYGTFILSEMNDLSDTRIVNFGKVFVVDLALMLCPGLDPYMEGYKLMSIKPAGRALHANCVLHQILFPVEQILRF